MPTHSIEPPRPLHEAFPWTAKPLITGAPMRGAAYAALAVAVSQAGGLGFIGTGYDTQELESDLEHSMRLLKEAPIAKTDLNVQLPVGVGIIVHKAKLDELVAAITPSSANDNRAPPAAIWLFAPEDPRDLAVWADAIRSIPVQEGQKRPQVWVQAGSVAEMVPSLVAAHPDVLVVQGADAGGHGLAQGASIVPMIPECSDVIQLMHARGEIPFVPRIIGTGGIGDGRGVAAALVLGAEGVSLGTLLLATPEARIAQGYREEMVSASDGGTATVRSRLYDSLRGTDFWPARFGARGVTNESWREWERTGASGMDENRRKYEETTKLGDAGWGPRGRMTTYAGTGVGLVKAVRPAGEAVRNTRAEAVKAIARFGGMI